MDIQQQQTAVAAAAAAAQGSLGADNLPTGNLSLMNEQEVVRKAGRQAISAFLDSHNCFSVIRASGKVVVFDTRIPIQLAFYALVEHDMQTAPLWDPSICQFVGVLKVTDFIDILRHFRSTNSDEASLATRSIADIFADETITKAVGVRYGFWSVDSTTTLKQACKMLLQNSLEFLPIVMPEDMRVLACITYTNILEHLVTHFRAQRRLFDDAIYDLKIGKYQDQVVKVAAHQSLAEALALMHTHNLSALPVMDSNNNDKLVGVYSRSDITFLTKAADAKDAVANLNLKLQDVLEQQRTDLTTPDALHTCSTTHTLQSIFEYFAQLRFNRLFVLDEQERLVGVVSAKDLVAYFVNES
ncbi:MAG: hypothetical protein SGBAC_007246 [Bacillariaceae sp.]